MSAVSGNGSKAAPWVLVAGGFHRQGGMDKANAALAEYLCGSGVPVHLVSYRVDSRLAANPAVTVHRVVKPAGSFFLAQWQLDRLGRAVANKVTARSPRARVVVNGVNCDWPDINWVHWVHREWLPLTPDAPPWFRAKNRLEVWISVRRELRMLRRAQLLLANSERTRLDLLRDLILAPERVHTIYLGSDSDWKTVTRERRAAARAWLKRPQERPLVAFVGAFGHDSRKGFDTLWAAWQRLCARPDWDADLIVAGGGRALKKWRSAVARAGLGGRVKMLGFTDRVTDLLAASNLLVSPVRYESYGLNVQEAICCGVPAIVSASAGIAERYTPELADLLLPDPNDIDDLVMRMLRWKSDIDGFGKRVEPMARALRNHTWDDMARQIVTVIDRAKN